MRHKGTAWHGSCDLRFINRSVSSSWNPKTIYQGSCTAPYKLMRATSTSDGRCELPILHTAGGLVGGDQLKVNVHAQKDSRSLVTSVAAQKVYGSVGLSRISPKGLWAKQNCCFQIDEGANFEWIPQEVVLFANSLFQQRVQVDLSPCSSFLFTDVVRLGRTASQEKLASGCWRSILEISRQVGEGKVWEFLDHLELRGDALSSQHGMSEHPVFGSFVWIAREPLSNDELDELLTICRKGREGLGGLMSCSPLRQGISARYLGSSTQAARFWFYRIWTQVRKFQGLARPELLRVWPLQENPLL